MKFCVGSILIAFIHVCLLEGSIDVLVPDWPPAGLTVSQVEDACLALSREASTPSVDEAAAYVREAGYARGSVLMKADPHCKFLLSSGKDSLFFRLMRSVLEPQAVVGEDLFVDLDREKEGLNSAGFKVYTFYFYRRLDRCEMGLIRGWERLPFECADLKELLKDNVIAQAVVLRFSPLVCTRKNKDVLAAIMPTTHLAELDFPPFDGPTFVEIYADLVAGRTPSVTRS